MTSYNYYDKDDSKDQLKSAIITGIIWALILLFVFTYTIRQHIPEKKEVVTTMLINFGDNRNGNGEEEPASQDGSLAAKSDETVAEPVAEPTPNTKLEPAPEPAKPAKEKIITGDNAKVSAPKIEKATEIKTVAKASPKKETSAKTPGTKASAANSGTGTGDGKGTAAIGNLIKGRGTKPGTQGKDGIAGNAGDPLGGDGNGDSKIGVDRKLVGFIPGTMGRGGAQPSHNCSASGTINIAYTVDKAGNVISAKRASGVSDQCVVNTSVDWVKRYVKAEKASSASTGTYRITF
ncbi:hypothetical protein [Chryseobacterium koreense]|uniref:Ferric siderophore ABC transporter substrate-binding protein n=1 Tax=Chryseobacterium koreense CCUG 49689 TaxID=1304281 RepID=A0A0J7J020_9FLAO|nr:hypothetical protein [Chryseobacterium koreense]KMQ71421.1 ferric siderophore ABC transporter substrate-binding protein [Chryseobacterium koreense CCUG 49689]MBB5332261.1 hypothetical protein [Chryseobacterium koreense]